MTDDGSLSEDEELIAVAFDDMLQQLIDGEEPDPTAVLPERPDLKGRVREAYTMALSAVGRREAVQPSVADYEILGELGRGGMGTVYLARHEGLEREVALKVLPHSLGLSRHSKRRFLIEARAMARLRHDNIVRVHRIVERGEMLAYEMEWVEGPSLRQVLDGLRPHGAQASLSHLAEFLGCDVADLGAANLVQFFVRLGLNIARALEEVHGAGLVHRDVKPSNILLRKTGEALLADFGLARSLDHSMTLGAGFVGTPIYASPEQMHSGDEFLDGRADVYSLAATLYEAIALVPPFAGKNVAQVQRAIEEGRALSLRSRTRHAPKDLETIVRKAMEPNRRDRYASAGEFADDLNRLLELRPITARPVSMARRTVKFVRRQQRMLLAGIVGAVIVMAVLIPLLGDGGDPMRLKMADAAAHSARLNLISSDSREMNGHGRQDDLRLWRPKQADGGSLEALRRAVKDYERAVALTGSDERLRLELDIARLAVWLRTQSPEGTGAVATALESPEFAKLTSGLTVRVREVARDLVIGSFDYVGYELSEVEDSERLALGLLGFALRDFRLCELFWEGLEVEDDAFPLVEAGLGLLAHVDGNPERAYTRLFHGARSFPESEALAYALANAALATGDLEAARRWLLQTAKAGADDDDSRRDFLRADLLAAEGKLEEARAAYLRLAQESVTDPAARHRLARLAIARRDWKEADWLLRRLVSERPGVSRFRLDLARLALQRKDLSTYVDQARYVVANGYGAKQSSSSARDYAEILRLGGFRRLYRESQRMAGVRHSGIAWHGLQKPVRDWAPAQLTVRIESMIEQLAGLDRVVASAGRDYSNALDDVTRPLFLFPFALTRFPQSYAWLGASAQVSIFTASTFVAPFWEGLANDLAPRYLELVRPGAWQRDVGVLHLYTGEVDPALFLGVSVCRLGDVDGDGHDDVPVSSVSEDARVSPGVVRAISGRDASVLFVVRCSAPHALFGFWVAQAGDVDSDGFPDFVVGAPDGVPEAGDTGVLQVHSGRDGALLHSVTSDAIGFGVCADGVGDLDGDGCDDFVVGTAPQRINNSPQGGAKVFSGRDGTVLFDWDSPDAGVWFGSAVSAAGDIDRDGTPDVIVGGNLGGAPGVVRVYSGRNGSVLHTWRGESGTGQFGRSVAGGGDVDGDGYPDVLVGAPGPETDRSSPGRLVVFSGRDGSTLMLFRGLHAGGGFGFSVANTGDVDGDGHADLLVGAPYGGLAQRGYVSVISGRDGQWIRTAYGPAKQGKFGFSVGRAGDVNADGVQDFVVGGPQNQRNGCMALFSGQILAGYSKPR